MATEALGRAGFAAELATMQRGTRTDLASIDAMSDAQAATLLNVSARSIVVFGVGIQQAADIYRMRRSRALRLLRAGLDRYADFA